MLQKLDKLIHKKWRYALVLPLFLFGMHMYAFNTYQVITTIQDNDRRVVDTIPEVRHVYRVDTTTIFDYDTYKETVEIKKVIIGDTILVFDKDTYTETVSVIPRAHDCYVLLWGDRAFGNSTKVSQKQVKKLFRNKSIKISPIKKECDKITSWSGRIIIVPSQKDPMVKIISMDGNNNLEGMIKGEEYNAPGTRIFIEKLIVNGDIELDGMVLTIE